MTDLDLGAVRERYAAWEAAQDAAYGLPGSAAARECDERAMDCGHDVPALLAEIERLRSELFTLTNSEDARVFIVEQERDAARRELEVERAAARADHAYLRNELDEEKAVGTRLRGQLADANRTIRALVTP